MKNRTRRRIAVNPYQLYATQAAPRTPAADADFMSYVLGIPSRLKLNRKLYLEVLRQNFPELTKVPAISGGEMISFVPAQRVHPDGSISGALAGLGAKAVKRIRQIRRVPGRMRRWFSVARDSSQLAIQILQLTNLIGRSIVEGCCAFSLFSTAGVWSFYIRCSRLFATWSFGTCCLSIGIPRYVSPAASSKRDPPSGSHQITWSSETATEVAAGPHVDLGAEKA
ncbi:hypothetical protein SBA4_20014 [Candidatus Sulfopaludibacter sp. SbA4]|nr:hypothetical protein SBA4_20014 [Candidatus Sulfopaludibacter sp. SbA4]